MSNYYRITNVEFRKIFKRRAPYILMILVIVMAFIVAALMQFSYNAIDSFQDLQVEAQEDGVYVELDPSYYNEETYEQALSNHNETIELMEAEKENNSPNYIDRVYKNALNEKAIIEYQLDNGIVDGSDIYMSQSTDFLREQSQAFTNVAGNASHVSLIFISMLIILSLHIAGEFENNTIKTALLNPGGRRTIILAKFTTVLKFGLIVQVVNYLSRLLSSGIVFGFDDPMAPYVFAIGQQVFEMPIILYGICLYIIAVISLVMPMALALLVVVISKSNVITITVTMLTYFVLNPILLNTANSVKGMNWLRFSPFLNMHLEDYLIQGVLVDNTSFIFTLIMSIIYGAVFLILSAEIFNKTDV